jgi:hypothetical protein
MNSERIKMEPVQPGDLEELLQAAFAAGAGYELSFRHMNEDDQARWNEYRKSPAPRSTYQRVDHVLNIAPETR